MILFFVSSVMGIIILFLEFYNSPFSYTASTVLVVFLIYFRKIGAVFSIRSTAIENVESDSIITLSAAIWFVLMESLKYVLSLITETSVFILGELLEKIIAINLFTLAADLVSNSYFYKHNKPYRDYR